MTKWTRDDWLAYGTFAAFYIAFGFGIIWGFDLRDRWRYLEWFHFEVTICTATGEVAQRCRDRQPGFQEWRDLTSRTGGREAE